MNDKIKTYIGLLSLSALLLSSCSREEPTGHGLVADDDEILFTASLPGVQTRSGDIIDGSSILNGFYVSAANMDSLDDNGKPSLHFEDELVTQTPGTDEAFRSENCRWPSNKGKKNGKLRFFAFYPSFKTLRESAGIESDDNQFFILQYTEVEKDSNEYWIKKFKINEDIAKHSDFVTAKVDGSKSDNLYSGVRLALQHQLSKIHLEAFGNSDSYDVEIAGVRIGGIATESDFSFEGTPPRTQYFTKIGKWTGVNRNKSLVEYIFREGDTVVPITKEKNPDKSKSVSIMGKGGHALLIPYDYFVWNYSNNKTTGKDYLYFSVLLRVKERATENKTLLYPYIEGEYMTSKDKTDKMNVVYLSIETNTGKVMKRVYKKGSDFFEDPKFSKKYEKPVTEDIRNYGWASAIPPTNDDPQIRWNAGFQYFYQLDYSKGIGVQDPADAFPGRAIIAPIEVTGTETTWHTVTDFEEDVLHLEVQK